ncbi:MAG: integrase core domain-containing protein [Acidimicrobiia bacterium]
MPRRWRRRLQRQPYSEAQLKTLKYWLEFPARFSSLGDAHAFCIRFFDWYNDQRSHSGIGFRAPAEVHYGPAEAIQVRRATILGAACAGHPERFVRRPPGPPPLPGPAWIKQPREDTPDTANT